MNNLFDLGPVIYREQHGRIYVECRQTDGWTGWAIIEGGRTFDSIKYRNDKVEAMALYRELCAARWPQLESLKTLGLPAGDIDRALAVYEALDG